jgi:hypothetical protein
MENENPNICWMIGKGDKFEDDWVSRGIVDTKNPIVVVSFYVWLVFFVVGYVCLIFMIH